MCGGCAMVAMTGATATRTYLQAHRGRILTPRRLRAATIGVFAAATIVSTVSFSGSGQTQHPVTHAAASPPAASATR